MLFASTHFRFLNLIRCSIILIGLQLCSTTLWAQIGLVGNISKEIANKVSTYESRNLRILSWNLHLLPAIAINKHQKARAKAIGEVLQNSKYDVIVFQEAFHRRAQKLIWKALGEAYPFQYGPRNGGLFKFSSGIWIISKLELKNQESIAYSKCNRGTADCRAKKGALFVLIEKEGKQFQIIGTHLQAKEGDKFQKVRIDQLNELSDLLIKKNKKDGIPFIITGDMNIAMAETEDYQQMLSILGVENGEFSGEYKFTSDHSVNDMYPSEGAKGEVIDYVLFNKMGANIVDIKRAVKIFRTDWRKKRKDLSDHFAVEAIIYY